METLKMKFKLNGLEFEVEGNEETVKEEFEKFKSFISGELLTKIIPPIINVEQTIGKEVSKLDSLLEAKIITTDFPVLHEVVQTDLPKTEKHWALIYGFYSAKFGESSFASKDVISLYRETKRWTDTRAKNIAGNIKDLLKDKLIKALNSEDYIFTENGKDLARNILEGKVEFRNVNRKQISRKHLSNASDSNAVSSKSKKAVKGKSILQEKFDLHKSTTTIALEDFLLEKKPKNTAQTILVIGYYITTIKNINSFSDGNIDYAYRVLNIKGRPAHLRQIIINAKNSNDFFDSMEDGKWLVTRTGEIFVEEKMLDK